MGEGSSHSSQQQQLVNLFEYSEEQLLGEHRELTHYQILNVPEYASQDDIKKAYRKTSLKYHPDKTGRGDNDYVFLAVKQAHDVLFDHGKRQAYDSTAVPFDDQIPPPRATLLQDPLLLYTDDDFYATFGPVFERNLRFDLRLRPDLNKNSRNSSTKNSSNNNHKPPSLGDARTPLAQVHAFYEYWVHFESWRDFSAQAADELDVEQHLENAESRYEKRWYQKEVDRRAKQLKRQEMGRIATLVERAVEADPRLRRERAAQVAAKEEAAAERQRQKERLQQQQRLEHERRERLEQEEAERAAAEKLERDKEKKQLRKARQQLRKMASASFEERGTSSTASTDLWQDEYDLQQDVEFLCRSLDLERLSTLSKELQTCDNDLELLHERVTEHRKAQEEETAQQQNQTTGNNNDNNDSSKPSSSRIRNNDANGNKPWTKDELSALAKAVKKYPPGGASRWDQICLFVNNLCKQPIPRSREECIECYNSVARNGVKASATASTKKKNAGAATASNGTTEPPAAAAAAASNDDWTTEQDQQLQDALAKYPASMEKNQRWSSIATAVPGKTKKQCVNRFKAIREALKKKK